MVLPPLTEFFPLEFELMGFSEEGQEDDVGSCDLLMQNLPLMQTYVPVNTARVLLAARSALFHISPLFPANELES